MLDTHHCETYGWFRDLDTIPDVVVLECKKSVTNGRTVYCVRPLYISPQTTKYALSCETVSSSGVLILNNQLVDDIESQTVIKPKPVEKPIVETYMQQTKRLLYVAFVCLLYICICCC